MQSKTAAQGITVTQVRSGAALLKAIRAWQGTIDAPALFIHVWDRYLPTVTVLGATNASPIVVNATAHGFAVGDLVTIEGMVGATGGNGTWEISAVGDADHFTLKGTAAGGVWVSDGIAYAQRRDIINIPLGDANGDGEVICREYHSKFGGLKLASGLSYAVSSSRHRITAPDAGDEPTITVDYEEVG